jgi:sugar lactone lactonase YvrE
MLRRKLFGTIFLRALLMFVVSTLAGAQVKPSDLKDAALVVGNLGFGPTDGVLRYDGKGNFIDNMAPVGVSGNILPCCIAFGPDENLYVSTVLGGTVLRFNGVTGEFIDTFIPAGSGGLQLPLVLLFRGGYLYVGDTGAGAIRRYNASTGAYVDNFVPDNSQGLGIFGDVQHFAFGPDHNLYIAAEFSGRVLRYNGTTGAFIDEFVPASAGFLPSGLTFGPGGMMYVGSYALSEVRRYDITTGDYELFVPSGERLQSPVGITFGPDGDLYATNVGTQEILRYDGGTGRFKGAFVASGAGGLSGPRTLTWKLKITVCHQSKTLAIGYLSAADHLQHGDTVGPCQ